MIMNSLRSIGSQSSVPALPYATTASKEEVEPALTPFQVMRSIINPDSASSRWMAAAGLLQKFNDCVMDMKMTTEGGVNAILRSEDGYRRTILCRPDGSHSQRITDAAGNEIVRFNSLGQPVFPDLKRELVPAMAV
jgi:hypothetical protein